MRQLAEVPDISIVSTLENLNPIEQEEWLKNTGLLLRDWGDMVDTSISQEDKILYTVYTIWDELSLESRSIWKYDFHIWAGAYAKKRATREPARITIHNKIRVYRDFVAERKFDLPESIFVPKEKLNGESVEIEDGSIDLWDEIDSNPEHWDFSKKLISRGAINRGEMTPEAWTALADSRVTVNQLKEILFEIREGVDNKKSNFYLFEESGTIFCNFEGRISAIMMLIDEDIETDAFREGIKFISNLLNLKLDMRYTG